MGLYFTLSSYNFSAQPVYVSFVTQRKYKKNQKRKSIKLQMWKIYIDKIYVSSDSCLMDFKAI